MESKKDKAVRLLKMHSDFLTCPVCGETLNVKDDYTLRCVNHHSFDISRKGIINLAGGKNDKIYDDELFRNRKTVIQNGYYEELIDVLTDEVQNLISSRAEADCDNLNLSDANQINILDAGCGEGSFLDSLKAALDSAHAEQTGIWAGIDLSKAGINLATDNDSDILWLIDDLAALHVKEGVFDVILDILSPSNRFEFKRVLTDDGIIIKVIPGQNYLKELRALTDLADNVKSESDESSLSHTEKWMEIYSRKQITYTINPGDKDFSSFMKMTPMMHGKYISDIMNKTQSLTIDLVILTGKPR